MATTQSESPWYNAFPAPKTDSVPSINREDLLQKMNQAGDQTGKDFVLIDLRRTDYEGGTIKGSINIPAQTMYDCIPSLYGLFKQAGVRQVIWYCGSSRGRGSRAAAWFADYLTEQHDAEMQSLTLQDGIKGWVKGGENFIQAMTRFDASAWQA